MRCTLLNENVLCRDTGDVRGVNSCIHLSQRWLPSQPTASAWDTVLSTDLVHFQSCALCFAEAARKVERATLLLAPMRNDRFTALTRWDLGQGLPRSH